MEIIVTGYDNRWGKLVALQIMMRTSNPDPEAIRAMAIDLLIASMPPNIGGPPGTDFASWEAYPGTYQSLYGIQFWQGGGGGTHCYPILDEPVFCRLIGEQDCIARLERERTGKVMPPNEKHEY